jgi:hypothetical protein
MYNICSKWGDLSGFLRDVLSLILTKTSDFALNLKNAVNTLK